MLYLIALFCLVKPRYGTTIGVLIDCSSTSNINSRTCGNLLFQRYTFWFRVTSRAFFIDALQMMIPAQDTTSETCEGLL